MAHDKSLTRVNQSDLVNTDPILQYFTAIRQQEPEYEHPEGVFRVDE